MGLRVFISYRRVDAEHIASRISDQLKQDFGDAHIFIDVASIKAGEDFRQALTQAIRQCDVMLVIIGQQWHTELVSRHAAHKAGKTDWVRYEVAAGLSLEGLLVIPVLVNDASLPAADKLPKALRDLLHRNAVSIRNGAAFKRDVQALVDDLTAHFPNALPPSAPTSGNSNRDGTQVNIGGNNQGPITIGDPNAEKIKRLERQEADLREQLAQKQEALDEEWDRWQADQQAKRFTQERQAKPTRALLLLSSPALGIFVWLGFDDPVLGVGSALIGLLVAIFAMRVQSPSVADKQPKPLSQLQNEVVDLKEQLKHTKEQLLLSSR